jgi:Ser/Thr protein kinase RdoA (MazF antagonist)
LEQWIEELYSTDILHTAASKYDADATNAKKLGDFENYVFEVKKNGSPYILRMTHSSHRSKNDVESELQWINFLHSKGLNVSLVHQSEEGNLVEEIAFESSSFFICLFDKAPGRPVKMSEDFFGPALFDTLGQTIGKMHRYTKDYQHLGSMRERWDEEDLLNFRQYLKNPSDEALISDAEALVQEIKKLPETRGSFGLIHSDLHLGNFFYHEGEIHAFDFDDCSYHYYISDIAIPIYYPVMWKLGNEDLDVRSKYGQELIHSFLKGYQKENQLDPVWMKRIPLFFKLRDYILYTVFHKKWDIDNLEDNEKQLLERIRSRLVQNEPLIELNFEKLLNR